MSVFSANESDWDRDCQGFCSGVSVFNANESNWESNLARV